MIDKIKENAKIVRQVAEKELDIRIGFDREGAEWLDGYIQRQHESGDSANFTGLTNTLGSFFGECIISTYGGAWTHTEYGWGIGFDHVNAAFPFAKVRKHLENGADDSVLGMFDSLPVLFVGL
jgi:hypothetical protein